MSRNIMGTHEKAAQALPITHSEMQALLEPMQNCLRQMESTLQEISTASWLCMERPGSNNNIDEESQAAELSVDGSALDMKDAVTSAMPSISAALQDGSKLPLTPLPTETAEAKRQEILPDSPSQLQKEEGSCGRAGCSLPMSTKASPGQLQLKEEAIKLAEEQAVPTDEGTQAQPIENSEENATQPSHKHSKYPRHHHDTEVNIDMLEKHNINKVIEDFRSGHNFKVSLADKMILLVEKYSTMWAQIQEPVYTDRFSRVIRSRHFETLCVSAIILNSASVSFVSNWSMQNIGAPEPQAFAVFEMGFTIFFLLELILRLMAHRLYFFVNNDMNWNIFDMVLVSISVVDFIFSRLIGDQAGGNVSFMRLLRLLKLARIFRSLRSFRFFKQLALLLESFQKSFMALFWGFVMLVFVLYIFSLIFIQALIEYLTQGGDDVTLKAKIAIDDNFGTLGATILSLYKAVTGGADWGEYYDIMCYAGPAYGIVFVLFTFFFVFALFNILTGSLVEKAMSSSKPDRTELILNQRKARAEQSQKFAEICKLMDADKDGKISWSEFQDWMNNPVMVAYMASIGLDIDDSELFFSTVSARSHRSGSDNLKEGEVIIQHFVEGCMHMQGSATGIDMQRQLYELRFLHNDLKHLEASITKQLQHMDQAMRHALDRPQREYSSLAL